MSEVAVRAQRVARSRTEEDSQPGTARVDWATLLRRTFEVDVLQCPSCGGRLRVLGKVTDPATVRLLLESLELPPDAPRAARARDPTELLGESDDC